MTDSNSFSGRIRRYAQVSTTVGGLAARLAGERYLGLSIDRSRHAAELTTALGGVKGPLMKVAQLLATIPEALPREYAGELAQLQANAPPMGWPFVKRRMAGELGSDWESKFHRFEHEAARAASLGQVHRAEARNGRALACKLQYPGMESAVEADLNQLRLILSIYQRYDRSVTTTDIYEELAERLREELDYRREAAHMRLYRAVLKNEPSIHVPEPVEALSTGRLLTMNWLEGKALVEAAKGSLSQRNAIAQTLFRAWYVPFYCYGVIHGDPHLGNYTVCDDQSVNLLDFGCVRVFPSRFVKGVIDLYHALDRDDETLAIAAYESWGFTKLSRELVAALNRWARFLYAPLMDDRKRHLQEKGESDGRDVVEGVHIELKRLGGVRPPREFVFMDRAAIGLGSVFIHLKAEVNWHRLFMSMVEDFDEAALAKRQLAALKTAGVPDKVSVRPP